MASYYLILLLLALNALSILANDVSIDCGTSDSHTDENLINWVGDDDLIQNGESMIVQSNNTLVSQTMRTSRLFTTRRKNCYNLDAEEGKQFLVRASFYYGNYDGKSSPPIFDLHFDGNHWITVVTSMDIIVYHEAIYVAKQNTISVCVAQLYPNMLPFISALELRSLELSMYNHVDENYALILRRRVALGTKEVVRYPNDLYDRIWIPASNPGGFTEAKSDALIAVNQEDNPPTAVLQNAFISSNTSVAISFSFPNLPSNEVPIYMNMYFSEVSQLDSTEERSILFYLNDVAASDPIIPPYGEVMEVCFSNLSASSNTSFALGATSSSTLPPLINALELFTISDELTDGTSIDDVNGLAVLQENFAILGEWGGDPCLPSPFKWDWVNCSYGATPRVTALYLSDFDLSGSLPDFGSMDALETIDLQNNSLSGSIPDFLGTLPNLKQLNLADNDFSGPVPSSLSQNTKLKLVVTGNPNLCVSDKSCKTTESDSGNSFDDSPTATDSNKKKSSKLPIILGATIPAVLLTVLGVLIILHHRRKSAAVAAATIAGQTKVANGPNIRTQGQGQPMNLQMVGNVGLTATNEFMVNIQEQTVLEDTNQTNHHHSDEGHHDTTNT